MGRPGSAQGWNLETAPAAVAERFLRWQTAMRQTAEQVHSNHWWLREEGIGVRLRGPAVHGVRGADLATNWRCNPAAVQINMPSEPGDVDGNSQVGTDHSGRVWLLRQGRLTANPISARIDEQRFQDLTGLSLAFETPARGNSPARWWFRVCRLDVEDGLLREQTVDYVRRCQQARQSATSGISPPTTLDVPVTLQGNLEPTGSYVIPPLDIRVAERIHGEVVNELKRRLDAQGIPAGKVRCVDGYEVDLVVGGRGSSPLLVEVKTGAVARDVQTGVGQLSLYRRLVRQLRNHTPVLLLPASPTAALATAVRECGVELHFYEWVGQRGESGQIRFDENFLSLCGLG